MVLRSDPKLVRLLLNFFRDEFLVRVQRSIHRENMRRHLGSTVSTADNEEYKTPKSRKVVPI